VSRHILHTALDLILIYYGYLSTIEDIHTFLHISHSSIIILSIGRTLVLLPNKIVNQFES
jgi:hypothetical protein